jgi:cell division inhibitor SulA/protein ImuA
MPLPSLIPRSRTQAPLLWEIPGIWRAHELADVKARSTGHMALDALLPGGGWPIGALTELIPLIEGIGEVALLQMSLKRLCDEKRHIVFVHPPYIPYAPALLSAGLLLPRVLWIDAAHDEDAHWAAEQTLREGAAGAVLLWSHAVADRPLRRLQLAAEAGESLAFIYRPVVTLNSASPAALRIVLRPAPAALGVEVLKVRGGRGGAVVLPVQAHV